MSVWRRLFAMITTTPRQRRAQRWAADIHVTFDERNVSWDVGPVSPEFATTTSMPWNDVSGVSINDDAGYIPPGITVLRRGARTADFLPMEAEGVRALLAEAKRRGLIRLDADLIAERVANGGSA